MALRTEQLMELTSNRGAKPRVDAAAGIVRGVKILGLRSANGRRYLPEAAHKAIGLYEGAKVNVNHPRQPNDPRDYRERFGRLRNVRQGADGGLFCDLHYNPKHSIAEQFAWDAEHAPDNLGFSHNIQGLTRLENGFTVVEEITRVQSVDLVADPATTTSLYEGNKSMNTALQSYYESNALGQLPGASEDAKAAYRDLLVSAASDGENPDEADIAPSLALVSKSIEDFRTDVTKLRELFSEMNVGKSSAMEGARAFRDAIMEDRRGGLQIG